jgi:phage terminase small subunit
MAEKLTPKQEAFVIAYLETGNASEAYRRSYNTKASAKTITEKASRLLAEGNIRARIDELQDKVVERAIVTKGWVISRLVENVERAMQHEAVKDSEGATTGEYRYDGSVANRSLELLGKELKMFVDRKEVGAPGEFDNLTAYELRERIRRETEALGLHGGTTQSARGSGAARSKPN